MAMTADGKIATADRGASSFGSRRDQEHLLELRALADAVIAGARTVDSAPVTLGPGPARFRRQRLRRGLAEYNLRVIVSRTCSISPEASIFAKTFSPIVVLTTERAPQARKSALTRLGAIVKPFGREEVDLARAFRWLRRWWGVRRLLCEGGGELNSALFQAGLVNELHLTVCPVILGGSKAPTISDGRAFAKLSAATRLKLTSQKRAGAESFLVYEVMPRPRGPAARAGLPGGSDRR
jgi:riboflavin-specific deaminase-like protein